MKTKMTKKDILNLIESYTQEAWDSLKRAKKLYGDKDPETYRRRGIWLGFKFLQDDIEDGNK